MTHICENITLLQTSFVDGNKNESLSHIILSLNSKFYTLHVYLVHVYLVYLQNISDFWALLEESQ